MRWVVSLVYLLCLARRLSCVLYSSVIVAVAELVVVILILLIVNEVYSMLAIVSFYVLVYVRGQLRLAQHLSCIYICCYRRCYFRRRHRRHRRCYREVTDESEQAVTGAI